MTSSRHIYVIVGLFHPNRDVLINIFPVADAEDVNDISFDFEDDAVISHSKFPIEMLLCEVRQAREMSQQRLAEVLRINQSSVSKLERRTDMYISTLRSFIESIGGRLEINAVFPDGTVRINQFDLAKAIESSFGAWKDAEHPELAKGAGQYLRRIRKSTRGKRRG